MIPTSTATHYEREMGIITMLPRLGPGQGVVFGILKALQRNAKRHGRYDITVKNRTLAAEAGVSIRTVQRLKKKLQGAGLMIVKERFRKTAEGMRQICDRIVLVLTKLRSGVPFVARTRRFGVKSPSSRPKCDSSVTANLRQDNERKFQPWESDLWQRVNDRFDTRRL
jgi:hypothetical protein